jgi:hypothetical protein
MLVTQAQVVKVKEVDKGAPATGEEAAVEIESHWKAHRREQLGGYPAVFLSRFVPELGHN